VNVVPYAPPVVAAFVVTLVVTPLVRRATERRGMVDQPGGRHVHTKDLSRLGGVGIAAGVAAALIVQLAGERLLGWAPLLAPGGMELVGTLAGMAVVFAVGVVDDVRGLSPAAKLAGQIAAASLPIMAGLRIDYIGNPLGGGLLQLGYLSIPLTVLWIVAFANVINLIDGLDGLAAGVCAIAAVPFLLIAATMNATAAAVTAAALIGACVAFLRYNFHPASIIMGDSGAMFLGYTLATLALSGVMKSTAAAALAVPLLIVGIPVVDTGSAIVRRLLTGRPIQEADDGHIHHRLLHRGFDHRQTVLVIYGWSGVLAAGGYLMRFVPTAYKWGLLIVMAILSAFMASWLGLFEAARFHGDGRVPED
jgi:UDP-GlcNAc:undecaprenyl-phosphate GlcNAc-1-phosphate transferase